MIEIRSKANRADIDEFWNGASTKRSVFLGVRVKIYAMRHYEMCRHLRGQRLFCDLDLFLPLMIAGKLHNSAGVILE